LENPPSILLHAEVLKKKGDMTDDDLFESVRERFEDSVLRTLTSCC
jgi:hypothetical protein